MDPFTPKQTKKRGPEQVIQEEIILRLRAHEWLVMPTHGNLYQMGFPDLYCAHSKYGVRWIEVKVPGAFSFTPAQVEMFPKMSAHNVGIWILFSATDMELAKLWEPANWLPIFLSKYL